MVGVSLAVFVALYIALGVTDFVLMRRYARLDPPEVDPHGPEPPARRRRLDTEIDAH